MTQLKIAIFDDFYPDPWAVRRHALSLHYQDASSEDERMFYKGQLTTSNHPYAPIGLELLAAALNRPIYWKSAIGEFRLLTELASREDAPDPRTWIHYDSNVARYAGIVYLNPDSQCDGGTSFYRHRPFGWDAFPGFESAELSRACQTHGLDVQGVVDTLTNDGFSVEEKWELTSRVPMRFNRCVVFDGQQFHARDGVFGGSMTDGRLTQNFFFDVVEGAAILSAA